MAEVLPGTRLQSPSPRIVRREPLAGSCETQEEPVSPSGIHEALRCGEEIPDHKRSHAAYCKSPTASPEPCRIQGSEMLPAGVTDSAWPVADPSFRRTRDSRG